MLVCALLRRLWDSAAHSTRISKQDIDRAAEALLRDELDLFGALWDDCDIELRADLATLADADMPRADLSDRRLRAIQDRGFGSVTGKRLRSACRLMQRYARAQAPAIADLKRLLGSAAGFETHIRSVLEMRLRQVAVPQTDTHLLDFVTRAVSDLDRNPELAVNGVRGIATRALALIWEAELPPDRTLPSDWIDEWKHAGVNFHDDGGKLPRGYGPQCNVLRLATGTDRVQRKSRYVTKTTYLLIDHLQSVGDFGQHRGDFPETHVTVGFAASIVLAAIALIESLTADLQREHEDRPQRGLIETRPTSASGSAGAGLCRRWPSGIAKACDRVTGRIRNSANCRIASGACGSRADPRQGWLGDGRCRRRRFPGRVEEGRRHGVVTNDIFTRRTASFSCIV